MEVKLKYYVILSLDIVKGEDGRGVVRLKRVKPDEVKYPKFKVTETEVEDPEWCAKHRKYVGILSPKETNKFLEDNFCEACQTMGSITEIGWLPSVAFSYEDEGFFLNAYVSPILDEEDEKKLLEEIKNHPQSQILTRSVTDTIDLLLKNLEGFYERGEVEKSFHVDTKQIFLPFGEEGSC